MESGIDKVEIISLDSFLENDISVPIKQSIQLCNEAKKILSKAKEAKLEEKLIANKLALEKYQAALAIDSESLEAMKNIDALNKDFKKIPSYKARNEVREKALAEFPHDELSAELTYRASLAVIANDSKKALDYLGLVSDKLSIENKDSMLVKLYRAQALLSVHKLNLAMEDLLTLLSNESAKAHWNQIYSSIIEIEKTRTNEDKKEYSLIAAKLSQNLDPKLYVERAEAREKASPKDERILQDLQLGFLLAQNDKGDFKDEGQRHAFKLKTLHSLSLSYLSWQNVDKSIATFDLLCKVIASFNKNKLTSENLVDQERIKFSKDLLEIANNNRNRESLNSFVLRCFEEAIKLHPSHSDAYFKRLEYYYLIYKREKNVAYLSGMLSDLKTIFKLEPNVFKGPYKVTLICHIDNFIQICQEKRAAKDFQLILALLNQAVDAFPKEYRFQWELCLIKYAMGDKENAAKHFQKAIALAPNNKRIKADYLQLTKPIDQKDEKIIPKKSKPVPNEITTVFADLIKMTEGLHAFNAEKEKEAKRKLAAKAIAEAEAKVEAEAEAREKAEMESNQKKATEREARLKKEIEEAKLIANAKNNPALFCRSKQALQPQLPKISRNDTFSFQKKRPVRDSGRLDWRSTKAVALPATTDHKHITPPQPSASVNLKPSTKRTWMKLPPVSIISTETKLEEKEWAFQESVPRKKRYIQKTPLFVESTSLNVTHLLEKSELAVQLGINDWTLLLKNPMILSEKLPDLLQNPNFNVMKLFFTLEKNPILSKNMWDILSVSFQKQSVLVNNRLTEWFATNKLNSRVFLIFLRLTQFLTCLFPNLPDRFNHSISWIMHELEKLRKEKRPITLSDFYAFLLVAAAHRLPKCDENSIKILMRENFLIEEHFSQKQNANKLSFLLRESVIKWKKFHGAPVAEDKKVLSASSTSGGVDQKSVPVAPTGQQIVFYDPMQFGALYLNGQLIWTLPTIVTGPPVTSNPTPDLNLKPI